MRNKNDQIEKKLPLLPKRLIGLIEAYNHIENTAIARIKNFLTTPKTLNLRFKTITIPAPAEIPNLALKTLKNPSKVSLIADSLLFVSVSAVSFFLPGAAMAKMAIVAASGAYWGAANGIRYAARFSVPKSVQKIDRAILGIKFASSVIISALSIAAIFFPPIAPALLLAGTALAIATGITTLVLNTYSKRLLEAAKQSKFEKLAVEENEAGKTTSEKMLSAMLLLEKNVERTTSVNVEVNDANNKKKMPIEEGTNKTAGRRNEFFYNSAQLLTEKEPKEETSALVQPRPASTMTP